MISSYDRTAVRPAVGTLWVWEPRRAPALAEVTAVRWNGEEWWVRTRVLGVWDRSPSSRASSEVWNDLSRFWEACHYVAASAGPAKTRGAVRRGEPQPDEMAPAAA